MISEKFRQRRFERVRRLRRLDALAPFAFYNATPPLAGSVNYENPPSFQNGE